MKRHNIISSFPVVCKMQHWVSTISLQKTHVENILQAVKNTLNYFYCRKIPKTTQSKIHESDMS